MTRALFLGRSAGAAWAAAALSATCLAGGESTPVPAKPSLEPLPAPAQQSNDFRVFWRDGVRFETADKAFSAGFGGRIQNDWAWQSGDEDLDALVPSGDSFDDGVKFRRARLHVEGKAYEHLSYKVEFDFAGGSAGWRDVYLSTSLYEFSDIKVGHFKQPFGLEQLTSSNNMTFMERSTLEGFTPFFKTGLALGNQFADGRATWAASVFRETDAFGNDTSDNRGYGFAGRLTYLPVYADDGASVVHLGLAATHRQTNDDELRYRVRAENSFGPRLIDTGAIESDDRTSYGLEAAWVQGPLSLQGEYMLTDVSSGPSNDPSFSGFYAMVSYFLTGEHRPYRKASGIFDRIRPKKNWGKEGSGAWEVAARYSSLDLDDGPVTGGQVDTITGGVNWYLNPNARVMLNYVLADVDKGGVEGDAEAVLLRFQVTF